MADTVEIGVDIVEEFHLNWNYIDNVTLPDPVDSEPISGYLIDVPKYYPGQSVILVETETDPNPKRLELEILSGGRYLRYVPDPESDFWLPHHQDTFTYVVQDTETHGFIRGTITLRAIPIHEIVQVDAEPHLNLRSNSFGVCSIDLSEFYKVRGLNQLIITGGVDKNLIKEVKLDPTGSNTIEVALNNIKSEWQNGPILTWFNFSIGSTEYPGAKSVGRVVLAGTVGSEFAAHDIIIQITDTLSESILIDLTTYFGEVGIELVSVVGMSDDRGEVEFEEDGTEITYTFNAESGFWSHYAQDVLTYVVVNSEYGRATGTLTIRRVVAEPPVSVTLGISELETPIGDYTHELTINCIPEHDYAISICSLTYKTDEHDPLTLSTPNFICMVGGATSILLDHVDSEDMYDFSLKFHSLSTGSEFSIVLVDNGLLASPVIVNCEPGDEFDVTAPVISSPEAEDEVHFPLTVDWAEVPEMDHVIQVVGLDIPHYTLSYGPESADTGHEITSLVESFANLRIQVAAVNGIGKIQGVHYVDVVNGDF